MSHRHVARLVGWRPAIALAIGGDTGGMLRVAAHFVVTPTVSVLVLLLTVRRAFLARDRRTW